MQEMEEEAEDEVPQKARFNIDVPLGDEDGKAKSSAKKSAGKLKISDKVSSIEEQENEALERQTEIIKSHAQSIGEKADSGMTPPPKTIEEIIEGSDKSNTEEKPPFEVPEGAGVVMEKEGSHYRMPPVTLLNKTKKTARADTTAELKHNADKLVDVLRSFGVETRIIDISRGPTVTRYELQPSAGVK